MKKNLAVRAGAIAMVLLVAFFSILPDLVNAEGDDAASSQEEVLMAEEPVQEVVEDAAVETPAEQTPEVDPGAVEAPEVTAPSEEGDAPTEDISGADTPASTEEPVENPTEDPTEPSEDMSGTEENGENGENPAEGENPDKDPSTEIPSVQEPDGASEPTGAGQDSGTEQTTVAAGDASGEMDTVEDYIEILEQVVSNGKADSLISRLTEGANLLDLYDLAESDEDDFIIEGSTIVGYQGDGGYITIPATVTEIGDGAFFGVTSITGVAIPANVWRIGDSAFNSCVNLRSIAIPDTVVSVGASAFANCTGLAEAAIGAGAGIVSANEFSNCTSLQGVSIAEGISSIESGAFAGCNNLGSISLPSTLANLDPSAFSGDVNLASVSVASGSYSSYDGCVYTGGGARLLLCPQGKTSIAFSPSMQSVASGAFSGCNYLVSAVLPGAAGSIEANAFSGSALKAVTIPAAVTSIGSQSGWTPNVIYGYTGTTAESWARASNYIFESLDGNGDVRGIVNEEHIEDPDDGGGDSERGDQGSSTPTVHYGPSGTGSGTQTTISRNSGTPKTGVEDYGTYFLFGAFFLTGLACFAYSRKLRLDRNR